MECFEAVEKLSTSESTSRELEPVDLKLELKLRNKCDRHLLPVLFILLCFSFLDRVNIGNARLQGLEADLNMKGSEYNVALLIFFVTYITCEVPSNLVLKRIRPSIWLSGLIFTWGMSC
jgi:hypothetical protein